MKGRSSDTTLFASTSSGSRGVCAAPLTLANAAYRMSMGIAG
jgi:hypothetical protein